MVITLIFLPALLGLAVWIWRIRPVRCREYVRIRGVFRKSGEKHRFRLELQDKAQDLRLGGVPLRLTVRSGEVYLSADGSERLLRCQLPYDCGGGRLRVTNAGKHIKTDRPLLSGLVLLLCTVLVLGAAFVCIQLGRVTSRMQHITLTHAQSGIIEDAELTNFLLVGQDSTGLTDVIKVVSIHEGTKRCRVISLLRDTLVCCDGRWCKLGEVGASGDVDKLVTVIEESFRLRITHTAVINFEGMISLVDALGTVDIALDRDEAAAVNVVLESEYGPDYPKLPLDAIAADGRTVVSMDGHTALSYARIRHVAGEGKSGDTARTQRQVQLLDAVLRRLRPQLADMLLHPEQYSAVLGCITTDMDLNDLGAAAVLVISDWRTYLGEYESCSLPFDYEELCYGYDEENGEYISGLYTYPGVLEQNTIKVLYY